MNGEVAKGIGLLLLARRAVLAVAGDLPPSQLQAELAAVADAISEGGALLEDAASRSVVLDLESWPVISEEFH